MSWMVVVPLGVALLSLVGLIVGWRRLRGGWRVLLGLFLVAGLLVGGASWMRGRRTVDPLAGGQVYTVTRGDVAEVVEATGNLSPKEQATLSFSVQGTLAELLVRTGDRVQAGQPLARLEQRELELQVAQAKAALEAAQANLDKALAGSRPEDVRAAQASLDQAQANLEELSVTLAASVEQARLSWIQSANALRDAQANYENIYWQNRELEDRLEKIGEELPDANRDAEAQAWRAVENAQAAMEQARLAYEQALQRQQTSLRSAQDQVDSARANLQRLLNGATTAEIAALKAAVAQAQASYDLAVAQLEKATLTAPFSGVVGTVLARQYDRVAPGTPILVLLDPSAYFIDVEVDEADIGRVVVGQEAEVSLDALPGTLLSGRVAEVALSPTTAQGVITYRVRVQLDRLQEAAARPGMTANVRIITRRASGVLVVPRRAVRVEGEEATVEKVSADGRLERIPVQLGIGDSFQVEIVSGLSEGDRVFVRGVVQRNQIQQILESGGERSRPVQP